MGVYLLRVRRQMVRGERTMTLKSFQEIPITPDVAAREIVRQAVWDWLRGAKSLTYYAMRRTRNEAERLAVLALL